MIYGFDIFTGITDDMAFKILGDSQGKLSQRKYDMPANNPIRSIINGALLEPNSELERIKNPVDEIYEKCIIYSL